MAPIYLDHNATTPLLPEAAEAVRRAEAEAWGNPSSAHAAGRQARRVLEDSRERVAAALGAHPDEVTFTGGATEANNLAVFGLVGEALLPRAPGRVAASHLEHPCVVEPVRRLAARGWAVEWWPADSRGVVQPAPVHPDTGLVCVMLANHETGAVQPVRDIAVSLPPGAALHCDAAQAVGKLPVNFRALGATTLAASAHKFGGPKGVGVLLVRRGTVLHPLLVGGHQQGGRRPGTEPVALAAGMAAALDHAVRNLDAARAKLAALRARLWERLREVAAPVVLNGPEVGAADVMPATLNVSFPGCRADLLLMALDLAEVACSAGSACSSGSLLPSPVLRAMGVPDDVLRSAVRFSFGPGVEFADVDDAAGRIGSAARAGRGG
ncbi:MAG: aminotransferase class V-fold PLP-dependent enzyme [Isosphaera sp.]|nr:aminotransferase class V-fold PLP-dependent enzyme [Isosphaera sp.]